MAKIGDKKKVEIAGEEFNLQHPGIKSYLRMQDEAKNRRGITSDLKLSELFFENVVVEKVDLDEIDSEVYFGLIEEIRSFLGA